MGTPRLCTLVLAGLSVGFLATSACGGGGDPPPAPLSRHFTDSFLASLPVDTRKAEIDAKSAYDVAIIERDKATADYNESKVQLDVARNERDAARLDEKSAASRAKAAQQSADQTRIKDAEKETQAAKLARDAAEKRYLYIDSYRTWLKRLMRFTEHNAFWKESQYELAQAKLAQQNNIQPAGFKVENFIKQEADRAKRTSDYKQRAEGDKKNAQAARTNWLALQASADKALGKKSEYPDPLAPGQVKGVNPDRGSGGYTIGNDGGGGVDDGTQPDQDPTDEGEGDEEMDEDDGGE